MYDPVYVLYSLNSDGTRHYVRHNGVMVHFDYIVDARHAVTIARVWGKVTLFVDWIEHAATGCSNAEVFSFEPSSN
jgi:hypothetical protein